MTPVLLYASSMAQLFRNTPEDSTPFLIWAVAGFAWYGVGAGIALLLGNIPNRFRLTKADWREHLWVYRQIYDGIGAGIGGLGVLMCFGVTYGGVESPSLSQMYAPLIGLGILITLCASLGSYFTRLR